MARRKPDDGGGGPNWLDTYADMVTLMLTFFVMLFAMSSMDSSKWKKLVQAFSSNRQAAQTVQQAATQDTASTVLDQSFTVSDQSDGEGQGGAGTDTASDSGKMDFDDLFEYINNYVKQQNLESSVAVHKGDGYTFITFQNSIFFSGDSAVLHDEGKQILDYLCEGLRQVADDVGEMRFYGHTARADDQKTPESLAFDRKLSTDRASNVLLYVQYKNIIDPKKMVAEGYGEYRPLVPHDGTEATRIKNRRVDIYIARSGTANKTLDEIYEEINPSGNINAASASSEASAP
jgi:chemotaxis protein MotB